MNSVTEVWPNIHIVPKYPLEHTFLQITEETKTKLQALKKPKHSTAIPES